MSLTLGDIQALKELSEKALWIFSETEDNRLLQWQLGRASSCLEEAVIALTLIHNSADQTRKEAAKVNFMIAGASAQSAMLKIKEFVADSEKPNWELRLTILNNVLTKVFGNNVPKLSLSVQRTEKP